MPRSPPSLRARLHRWMQETEDLLLDGPVPAPLGARLNSPDQNSADDSTFVAGGEARMTA